MYQLFIATPDKVIFEDEVISTIAPGSEGYMEILTNHAAIIAMLKDGKLTVTDKTGKKLYWHVSGSGYLEMLDNRLTLLLDSIEAQ